MDFKKLKAMSGQKSLETLNAQVAKLEEKFTGDERFWQPTVDKAGNGFAIIRFLPPVADEEVPFVRFWEHAFEGPTGQWYIEKSRTTLGKGEKDPVTEFNNILWKSSDEDKGPERTQVRKQKRKLYYVSNILVIKDEANQKAEGKVFLYKYGATIFAKLHDAQKPPFDDEGHSQDNPKYNPTNAFNPFDMWKGAQLRLKIMKKDGYRNFDNSVFDPCGPISDNDKRLEEIWKSEYPLLPFIDPTSFKSYEELKKRFEDVMDISETPAKIIKKAEEADIPWTRTEEAQKPKERPSMEIPDDDGDDSLEFFKNLSKM